MSGRWEGLSGVELARRWDAPRVDAHEVAGSTNDLARAAAAGGAPGGTVVVAEAQSAGRGRGGKAWASAPGLGLWMSVVLRPPAGGAPALLPILVGLAVAEALDPFARPAEAQVKWPNDVWVGGRKIAGVLCEASGDAVIAGIGVNVGHAPDDFPPEVGESATSLRIIAGWRVPLPEVGGAVLAAVRRRTGQLGPHLPPAVLTELARRDALSGRPVRVEGGEALVGTALGVNAAGALLVRSAGVLRTVHAGTVRPLEAAG